MSLAELRLLRSALESILEIQKKGMALLSQLLDNVDGLIRAAEQRTGAESGVGAAPGGAVEKHQKEVANDM